ncbi:MAG: hypothetical protein KC656_23950, partial [Myxococcales bacterium]|nr:hypothetical protein [Myxococcales bacterium]
MGALALTTLEHTRAPDGLPQVRAVAWSSGVRAAAPFAPRLVVDGPGGSVSHPTPRTPRALRFLGDRLLVLDEAGELRRDVEAPEVLGTFVGATELAVGGPTVAVLAGDLHVLRAPFDLPATVIALGPHATAVAVSQDGEQVLVGSLGGAVQAWTRAGDLLFEARAHTERVSAAVAVDDGWITAGWDGRVRRWSST